MEARDLPLRTGDEAARVIRALGQHRYVASRLHLVHAFAFDAISSGDAIEEARAWARSVLTSAEIDIASKDERLFRRATEAEVGQVVAAFWGKDAAPTHARLRAHLRAARLEVPDYEPFDETREEDVFPVLIDAGWELLPLHALDPERHKGAIDAFGERIHFEVAKFEEDAPLERPTYLQELPAIGAVELLHGADAGGALVRPLVLWTYGPEPYHDYVLRGVLRAAKLGGS